MKLARMLSLTFVLVTAGTTWAAAHDKHQAHHPANSASASAGDMAKMDTQMQAMRDIHEKMAAAKTPDERQALMAEHMKTMQDGMSMMNGMAAGGGGMACMDDKKGGNKKAKMKGEMHARHQMMEKRMEMMQSMMQMMMDRLPATPAK